MTYAELAVLNLVVEQPRHGYEIEQVIEARGMRDWTEIGFSSIYYLLKKLEEKGYVSASLEKSTGRGPARKIYHVTKKGRDEWYRQSLETIRTPARGSAPFLLGLSVFPAFSQEDFLPALKQYLASLEKRKAQMLDRATAQHPLPSHVETMFEYSQTMIDAEINWVSNYIVELEEHNGKD